LVSGEDQGLNWLVFLGKLPSLVFGLFLFYLGFTANLNSGLGMYPGGVFSVGVATHTPLSIGQVTQAVQLTFLILGWLLGFPPGLGTFTDIVLSGLFIDLLLSWGVVPQPTDPIGKLLLLSLGIGLIGAGLYFYLRVGLGAGPMDGFMLGVLSKTGYPVGVVRGTMEVTFLALGWALKGPIGIGTVITALTIGYSIQLAFKIGGYDPNSKHMNLYELIKYLVNAGGAESQSLG
jgi:uncharacterized membrane protein YczE